MISQDKQKEIHALARNSAEKIEDASRALRELHTVMITEGEDDETMRLMRRLLGDDVIIAGIVFKLLGKALNFPMPLEVMTFLRKVEGHFETNVYANMAFAKMIESTGICPIHGPSCKESRDTADHFPEVVDENLKAVKEGE